MMTRCGIMRPGKTEWKGCVQGIHAIAFGMDVPAARRRPLSRLPASAAKRTTVGVRV